MKSHITHYKVVSIRDFGETPSHIQLEQRVQQLIEEGWQPLGIPFFGEENMYQAMVKYASE